MVPGKCSISEGFTPPERSCSGVIRHTAAFSLFVVIAASPQVQSVSANTHIRVVVDKVVAVGRQFSNKWSNLRQVATLAGAHASPPPSWLLQFIPVQQKCPFVLVFFTRSNHLDLNGIFYLERVFHHPNPPQSTAKCMTQ